MQLVAVPVVETVAGVGLGHPGSNLAVFQRPVILLPPLPVPEWLAVAHIQELFGPAHISKLMG